MVAKNIVNLILWRNIRDHTMCLLLYDYQVPFKNTTLESSWEKILSFDALNPLIRPFPEGTELFNGLQLTSFPYSLITIYPLTLDSLDTNEVGTYFVAWTSNYPGTQKLPVELFIQPEHINQASIYVRNLRLYK